MKMLLGTVVEVTNVVNLTTQHISTFITANYHLGGGAMKQTKLNIHSVKPAPPAATPPADVAVPPANPVNPVVGTPPAVATPPANPVMPPPVPASPSPSPPPAEVASPLLTPVASPVPPPVPPPDVIFPQAVAAVIPPIGPALIVIVHKQEWFINDTLIKSPQNQRANNHRPWGIRDVIGVVHDSITDRGHHVS
jgi:hypothetical protein